MSRPPTFIYKKIQQTHQSFTSLSCQIKSGSREKPPEESKVHLETYPTGRKRFHLPRRQCVRQRWRSEDQGAIALICASVPSYSRRDDASGGGGGAERNTSRKNQGSGGAFTPCSPALSQHSPPLILTDDGRGTPRGHNTAGSMTCTKVSVFIRIIRCSQTVVS